MKRLSIVLMVLVLLMASTAVYGGIDDKLDNHWAKDVIDRSFMAYYFPYLARDNYELFDPTGSITEMHFNTSYKSLLKNYKYDISKVGFGQDAPISRKDMVVLLGNTLAEAGATAGNEIKLPFKDTNTLSSHNIDLLRLVYKYEIIQGDSNSSFAPNRNLSQVEAIIVLDRVKEVLEKLNRIDFATLGIVQTFSNQEEIIVTAREDKVLVTITKEFPTPGYSMSIDKILKENDDYRIYFNITPPKPDSIQLQVITYKTITIEIDKDQLGDSPPNFILDGYNKIDNKLTI